MNRETRTFLTSLLAATAPLVVALTWALSRAEVPDPLPTHWDLTGDVDDTTSLAALFTVTLVLSAGLAVAAVVTAVRSRHHYADRTIVAATLWAAWLVALVFVVPVLAAWGAEDASAVTLGPWSLAGIAVLPTVAAVACGALQPVVWVETTERTPPSTIRLEDHERAAWIGRSSSFPLLVVAGLAALAAVVLAFSLWPVAVLLALLAVVLFCAHVITVRVDDRSVTVGWGPARWPRLTVPVAEVVAARGERIEPLHWGGWGYRVSPRGTAAITRDGPGLVLERRGRRPLAVTVDHPETAVELVNALVERRDRPRGS